MGEVVRNGVRWRQIPEFPLYWVSELGEVASRQRSDYHRGRDWVVLREGAVGTHRQYRSVFLYNAKRKAMRSVHRLVIETFRGPCPPGHECAHLNGNPADNRLANLAWRTAEQNNGHKVSHGTQRRGEGIWNAKLTVQDVKAIRQLAAVGHSHQQLSERFGIHRRTVGNIVNRKTWRHVA